MQPLPEPMPMEMDTTSGPLLVAVDCDDSDFSTYPLCRLLRDHLQRLHERRGLRRVWG